MLLASLALAFFVGPQSPPPSDDGAAKVWDNLDVMRRMLVRQIGAKRDAISAAPKKTEGAEVVTKDKDGRVLSVGRGLSGGGDGGSDSESETRGEDSVVGSYQRLRLSNAFESSVGSEAEYVPGLAAIFSVTVPLKVRIVTLEPKRDEVKKPSETKNADDEAWEKVARGGDDPVDRHVKSLLGQGGKGQEESRRELKFDDAALKTLKETVVDTVARFGGRVGLAHGERLAVVVKLQAGSVVRDGDGDGDPKKGEVITGGGVADFFYGGRGNGTYSVFNAQSVARRFVLQVSADDLRAFRNGELDRDDLLKKMRLEEFTVPNAAVNDPFSSGWRAAK